MADLELLRETAKIPQKNHHPMPKFTKKCKLMGYIDIEDRAQLQLEYPHNSSL